ncbi:hypothetical protein [Shimia thalassica]|uniref:hypothetical protein n=1 Tax=Shimia thalassica TaxID=1715693 RepID=UPI000C06DB71|nr:hypothetical protein [Shimia thalassica]MDO6480278.1 hypothetical protein [Shimia thalassica]PHO02383.1 hypothetical protein CSC82_17730 [Rhodobacteraceae bacterium 4F10]
MLADLSIAHAGLKAQVFQEKLVLCKNLLEDFGATVWLSVAFQGFTAARLALQIAWLGIR